MCFSSCLLKQNWHNVIPTTAFAFFHPGRKSPGISTHVSQFALSHVYLCKSTAVPLLKPAFKQIWEAYHLVDFMSYCKGWKCQWITCAPSLMAKFDILMCGKMSHPNAWRTTKRSIIERKFWGFRSDWGKLPWVMSIKFFPYEILELLLCKGTWSHHIVLVLFQKSQHEAWKQGSNHNIHIFHIFLCFFIASNSTSVHISAILWCFFSHSSLKNVSTS